VPKHVAWVTGGGRGIGRACALELARAGHDVAVTARSPVELSAVAQEIQALGANAAAAPADVTDRAQVETAYRAATESLGAIDILVNGAGVARSAPFLKTTLELMEQHWRLNVLGVYHCTQVALPAMLERGWGRIVNIASVAGKSGAPYIASYAASKHAVLGLTRSLALEYAMKGVTVNAVCPGYVDTQMTDENVALITEKTGLAREEALRRIREFNPQKRLIQPEEVAAAVAHLARDDARGINGQALTIDGGTLQT
jgi:3-hydroxybutyrate dehydrogenase